ncbi:unnamed protein product, partial [marine sediment metagenome]
SSRLRHIGDHTDINVFNEKQKQKYGKKKTGTADSNPSVSLVSTRSVKQLAIGIGDE